MRVENEPDCIPLLERKLQDTGLIDFQEIQAIHQQVDQEMDEIISRVIKEPRPTPADIRLHTYAPSAVDAIYPDDYTGLPGSPDPE